MASLDLPQVQKARGLKLMWYSAWARAYPRLIGAWREKSWTFFDVLLPTHQQGFLFARAKPRIEGRAGFALPGFANYRAHSKAGFSPAALKHQRYNGSSSLPSRSRFGVAMSPSS